MRTLTIVKNSTLRRDYDLLYLIPEFDYNLKTMGVGMSRPEKNKLNNPDYPIVQGLPSTVPFFNQQAVPLKNEDGGLTDAGILLKEEFTKQCPTGWAVDSHYEGYIKKGVAFSDFNEPTAWNQISTRGNVLYWTGNSTNKAGELHYEFRCLKQDTYAKMKLQLQNYPYLKNWATTSTRDYGGVGAGKFPQCGGGDVPNLLFCKQDTNWVRASHCRILDRNESIPRLYFP